ncbi:TPA: putative phage abortive infection protein [Vibrio parahaemolyticus]|nr:putative phage abortive infection protein [Vibrio parahaemolyticus]
MKIKSLSLLLIGGVVCAVLLYGGALIALTWPINNLSISSSGVFGDSFGVLTSLFSGLAFAGLIITIVMQRDELSLQRQELNLTREELSGQKEEMKAQNETLQIQRFENTFFKMLEFLDNCRRDIVFSSLHGRSYEGRDAIEKLYQILITSYFSTWSQQDFDRKSEFNDECRNLEGIVKEYNKFYEKNGDDLGQYYRTFYNLLKLVDRADFISDKSVYTNLLRAQLSRYELLLLFYNCISGYGSEKMAPLVKKYNILKYLEISLLPRENIDVFEEFIESNRIE